MLEKPEGSIKNGQSSKSGNIGYTNTRRRQTKQTTCVGHHHTQTDINNANKTRALLQTTGSKEEPNTAFMLSLDVCLSKIKRSEIANVLRENYHKHKHD